MGNTYPGKFSPLKIIAIILFIVGAPVAGCFIFKENSRLLIDVFLLPSLALLALIVIVNIIVTLILINKPVNTRKLREQVLSHRDAMMQNFSARKLKVNLIIVFSYIYLAVFFIFVFFINTFLYNYIAEKVFVSDPEFATMLLVIPVLPFEIAFFILASASPRYDLFGELINIEEYPRIWELAKKAMDEIKIRKNLMIFACPGKNASVNEIKGGKIVLNLGIDLLTIIDSDELYAIMLHEFAHVKNDLRNTYKLSKLCDKWALLAQSYGIKPYFLFHGICYLINKNLSLFVLLSSYKREVEADRNISNPQDKQNAVNIFAKLDFDVLWQMSLPDSNILAAEKFPENYLELYRQKFINSYQKNKTVWDSAARNQAASLVETHPILPERMKNMGIGSFEIDFRIGDAGYLTELKKLAGRINVHISQSLDWNNNREYYYLRYKKVADEYKESQNTDVDLLKIAFCAHKICDYEVSLKLYSLFKEDKTCSEAMYYLGLFLCGEYKDEGIDYLFSASDNINYASLSLGFIGHYLQYSGNKDLINKYKEKFNSKTADLMDIFSTRFRRVRKNKLPENEIKPLREYVKSDASIKSAHLIEKKAGKLIYYILQFFTDDQKNIYDCFDDLLRFAAKKCPHIIIISPFENHMYYKFKNKGYIIK